MLAWSPDGRELVSTSTGSRPRVWSLELRQGVAGVVGLGSPDVAVSSGGGAVLFTSGRRGTVQLRGPRGEPQREWRADLGTSHVGFLRDGRFAVGDTGGTGDEAGLHVLEAPFPLGDCPPALVAENEWRPDGTESWRPLDHGRKAARFVSLSKDARFLLEASLDGNAYVGDLEQPEEPLAPFTGHQAPLVCAVFSTDETRIATASEDGWIRVWDRASRRTILTA